MRTSTLPALALLLLCGFARPENASSPRGGPVLEAPTLHCLGAYWIVKGDENRNAEVEVEYRAVGAAEWRKGPPLFLVQKGAHRAAGKDKGQSRMKVPDDAWLHAGSVFCLAPDTEYELKLRLVDPDGGGEEKTLRARTRAEPMAPKDAPEFHVAPGEGGGTGTREDPYKGLAAAEKKARPGDIFLLHAGIYPGTFTVTRSGEPGKPIVWRGAGDGEAVIDGKGDAPKREGRAISAGDVHDVWFERLTIRNADYGVVGHRSTRLVLRRCHIHDVEYGLTCTNNEKDTTRDFFICDNTIEGPSTWPRTKGIENARGIQVTGAGHVVCYNRVRAFADAIDTFPSQRCEAIDFHNNEISECTDDGIEMDYSERNTRCFFNRCTNVFQGITVQPIYGGPVYIFRNALYNVCVETFKMHNCPSGALMLHNTSVKKGPPLLLWTGEKVSNSVYRNNLFIGTEGRAYDCTAPMEECDFDFDGFGGASGEVFLKWNGIKYPSLEAVKEKAPIYKNAVVVDPATAFASGLRPPDDEKKQFDLAVNDLRLKVGSAAIDAGKALPGFNDGFLGAAPDLGAYELGAPLPHYGPRPEK